MIDHFGDLDSMIIDRQIEIVQLVTEEVVKYEVEIMLFAEGIAELDWCAVLFLPSDSYPSPHNPDDDRENVPALVLIYDQPYSSRLCRQAIRSDPTQNGRGADTSHQRWKTYPAGDVCRSVCCQRHDDGWRHGWGLE
jgi:hypothetical protein